MKIGIFIGRFQPVHRGHIHTIHEAMSRCDMLFVLIGSANQCRSIKNPWTYQERYKKIVAAIGPEADNNYQIFPLNDYQYSTSQWISDVISTVNHIKTLYPSTKEVVLFGHMKDGNDYLNWFPDWKYVDISAKYAINATTIRQTMMSIERRHEFDVPQTVLDDYDFYQKETELFKNYPFPDTLNFNCADAILECNGHVLLIERLRAPGRGCWALPGGFKNRNETFLDCAIRELNEETNVRVPEKVLRGSIVATKLFDSPFRSFGIPRNTLAVHMRIAADPNNNLPRANGADDAASCKWVPIVDALNNFQLYDDHGAIISSMVGVNSAPAYLQQKYL